MNLFTKPISCSLSPNTENDDVLLALTLLFQPWTWFNTRLNIQSEKWFADSYPNDTTYFYDSGRSALYAALQGFEIGPGDEVLVGAFTCVSAIAPILWVGATPVYVDIDKTTVSMDPTLVKKLLSKKSKALIVQHTFGILAHIEELRAICKENNIFLIEDCAHIAPYPQSVKSHAQIYSFGRDKALSSVSGGALIIQRDQKKCIERVKNINENLKFPSYTWVFQNVFHIVAFFIIMPLYQLGIGKILLVVFQKLCLLNKPIERVEYLGGKPKIVPSKYPPVLSKILMCQLKKSQRYARSRTVISQFYYQSLKENLRVEMPLFQKDLPYLRFPIYVEDPENMRSECRKQGILLGNWYHHVIDPSGVDLTVIGYKSGSCPNAEHVASHILNLPTRIRIDEAVQIVSNL